MNILIKQAKREDCQVILDLIKGLATYEKMLDEVTASVPLLEKELFDELNANVLLAYTQEKPVGFALYFYNFSTFKGKKGLYLEDLFIKKEYRSRGIGKELFNSLIDIAKTNNCGRVEWVCLNWNKPAIDFYKSKKATPLGDWITFRLDESNF
ncbi:MAG: GNAT family N-acetyltransferase [Tenericutes bacterium]|nr:GNAT family N-acetyltransferase [Mycoplasmatota bacterium]